MLCNFDLCGKPYEKEIHIAKVKASRANNNLAPSTNPQYTGAVVVAAAAALTAATTPFSIDCEGGIADVDDATQTTPAPAQSPTVPLNATTITNVIRTLDPTMLTQGSAAATLASIRVIIASTRSSSSSIDHTTNWFWLLSKPFNVTTTFFSQ